MPIVYVNVLQNLRILSYARLLNVDFHIYIMLIAYMKRQVYIS